MIGLAIRFALGGKAVIGSAFAWVTQSMTRILAVLLVLALLWGLIERNSRVKAEKVLASTETAYRNAQKDAKLAQEASDRTKFELSSSLSEKANVLSILASRDTSDAVNRFARANPVRLRCQTNKSGSSDTTATGLYSDPGQAVNREEVADMVAVPRPDLDDISEAAVQGAVAQRFLRSLVDAGLAVPESQLVP